MLTEREQFEAWMRDRGEDYLFRRDSPGSSRIGEYCRIGVQQSWECWQAARSKTLEQADDALFQAQDRHTKLGRSSIANWFKECRDIVRAIKEPTC